MGIRTQNKNPVLLMELISLENGYCKSYIRRSVQKNDGE